jgi:hypothetical protein
VVEQSGHLVDQLLHELRCDPMRARLALDGFRTSLRLAELDCDCVELDRDPLGCDGEGEVEGEGEGEAGEGGWRQGGARS